MCKAFFYRYSTIKAYFLLQKMLPRTECWEVLVNFLPSQTFAFYIMKSNLALLQPFHFCVSILILLYYPKQVLLNYDNMRQVSIPPHDFILFYLLV